MSATMERPDLAREGIAWLVGAWHAWAQGRDGGPSEDVGGASYDDCVLAERRAELDVGRLSSLLELWGGSEVRAPSLDRGRELLDLATHGQPTAAEWRDVGAFIRAVPEERPSGSALDALILNLMFALPRGVRHAFRLMRIAATDMAAVPGLRAPLVEGIRACLTDVDGPSFLEPIGLLDSLPGVEAHRLILALLEQNRSRPQRQFAAGLATEVLLGGDLAEAERSRLVVNVLAIWRSDPVAAREDLGQLIEVLPPGLSSALARDARVVPESGDQGLVVGPEEADRVVEAMVHRSLASCPELGSTVTQPQRSMLSALVRQSLFELNAERRWRASLVLSASPFEIGLADGVLDLLGRRTLAPELRRRSGALLNHVVCPQNVLRMIPFLADADRVVGAKVTTALGHATYNPMADQVLRVNIPVEQVPLGRARVYALGMTGSPGLAALAASRTAPRWQRHTARWWHENGTAIHS